ncbi:aminopeptidase N, partial [Vibrio fluvialis]|nr:aminopeptidase N [Vibrio fluvialis]
MAHTPQAKYRLDYQPPSHTITDIDLVFDLYDDATLVTAVSQVKQQQESNTLILDGETLELKALKVDGQDWQDYSVGEASLEIRGLPSEFTLTVVTKINPQANT